MLDDFCFFELAGDRGRTCLEEDERGLLLVDEDVRVSSSSSLSKNGTGSSYEPAGSRPSLGKLMAEELTPCMRLQEKVRTDCERRGEDDGEGGKGRKPPIQPSQR